MTADSRALPAAPARSRYLPACGFALLSLAGLEFAVMIAHYEAPPLLPERPEETAWLRHHAKHIGWLCLWIAAACVLFLSPRLKILLRSLAQEAAGRSRTLPLARHALAFGAFVAVSEAVFGPPVEPSRLSATWLAGWLALALTTFGSWLAVLAPGRFWLSVLRREFAALSAGGALGFSAWLLVQFLGRYEHSLLGQDTFWNALGAPTLQLAHALLSGLYSDLIYRPEAFILGAGDFHVEITYACSGIEGMTLIVLFLGLYFWLFRKELRFPQVFWLVPIGIAVIWLTNALRIAALVAIGASVSPRVAMEGFHAQAGWMAFSLIAFGAIYLTNRLQFFTLTDRARPAPAPATPALSLAGALLAPFLALMAAAMLSAAFAPGFDALYPLRVIALAILLYRLRSRYRRLGWRWRWEAPAVGAAVFVVWMLLEPEADDAGTALAQGLAELPEGLAAAWLGFRTLGTVVAIPLAEELAFRGYLIRKLASSDFEQVDPARFHWTAFLASSVLFGLLHERWLAGILAGMAYALLFYRRGQIGDAVAAHMTTNALIAWLALTQSRWSLWS